MRDPERIKRMLTKLEKLWLAEPDRRLGQLVYHIHLTSKTDAELFYAEDDVLEASMDVKL